MPVTRSSFLLRFRRGANDQDWRELVDCYRPLIEGTVHRMGLSGADVDDVVQDVLVQLFKTLPVFEYRRDRGRFRSWLRRVTTNKVRDRLRRPCESLLVESAADVALDSISEEEWKLAFRLEVLRYAVRRVREQVRTRTWQCFAGHVLERRTAAELSQEVGVSENAVYINSCRVMARIREICAQHGEELGNVDVRVSQR
jgi:RNA polymerase sigma-70 factor (ECF subfamily)